MKKILFFLFLAQAAAGQTADIQRTIDDFFSAFHKKDTIALNAVLDDSVVFHSVSQKGERPVLTVESRAQFVRAIASIPKSVAYEEKLLGYEIKIDGNMAHVWTPYQFFVNGVEVHGGVNSFQLFQSGSGWKIVYCIDTRRKA